MIKVLVVDDQPIFRESLKYILEKDESLKVVGSASNGYEAFLKCEELRPDVVLMDLFMPISNGVEGTEKIKSKYSQTKVIILTTFEEDEHVINALNNGADGYILKDIEPETLRLSIKSTMQGLPILHKNIFSKVVKPFQNQLDSQIEKAKEKTLGLKLKAKEKFIISLIVKGKSNKQISTELHLSEGRIGNIISEIFVKLNVQDRTQLAIFAIKNELID